MQGRLTGLSGAFAAGAKANGVVQLYTKLDCLVGRYLLGKQADNLVKFDSLREIAEAWMHEFCKAVPRATEHDFLDVSAEGKVTASFLNDDEGPVAPDQKTKVKAKAKPKGKPKPTPGDVSLSLFEVDEGGHVTSALGRLFSAGFSVGSTISLSSHPGSCWVVDKVSGTDVGVRSAGVGEEKTMSLAASSFLHHAAHAKTGDLVVQHPSWPASRASRTDATVDCFVRSRVWCAIEALASLASSRLEEQVGIFVKPRKFVKTKLAIPAGELRLVPEPSSVKIMKAGELAASEQAPLGLWEVDVVCPPSGFDSRVFLASGGGDGVSPFWFVETTSVRGEANMGVLWYKVSSIAGSDPVDFSPPFLGASSEGGSAGEAREVLEAQPDPRLASEKQLLALSGAYSKAKPPQPPALPPKASPPAPPPLADSDASRKRMAASVATASSHAVFEKVVFVPTLVNEHALPEGTVLKIHQGAVAPKAPKAARAISVLQLAKKAKV